MGSTGACTDPKAPSSCGYGFRVWQFQAGISTSGSNRAMCMCFRGTIFFPESLGDFAHRRECLRVSYAGSPQTVERGLRAIAEEVRAL